MGQSIESHLHQRKNKGKSMRVRRMASSTLIQTMVVKVSNSQIKSTSGASKLVGVPDRMDMKF